MAADPVPDAKPSAHPAPVEGAFSPKLKEASDEGKKAMARFRVPEGLKLDLFAAEPLLANPVAMWVDGKGRVYVAETFRHSEGATDTRGHMYWLDEDLAARTVEDRVAMFKKHSKDDAKSYTRQHDRVRLVSDEDGDGVADKSTVFADGFNGIADGIGAGLLEHDGDVFFTCIPSLWRLRDKNGDGVADEKTALSSGYGVHVAFIGHDLHGLRIGPDGKLYFTIGDRGLNVKTKEGKQLVYPDAGCLLRCELDGSELEIVHFGLRNPQEIAFNEFGDLFTVDNNSDSGDRARLIHLVEGADSGWRIGWQYIERPNARGPWNSEKLWHPQWDGQAAYIVPPLANISDGPSGLTYDPGVGLPASYRKKFLLCDFRGGSGASGIRTFDVKRSGAGYALGEQGQSLWSVLVTDADFGPDGSLYLTDWTEGWSKPMKGRIYRLSDPAFAASPQAAEMKKLFAEGFSRKTLPELAALLRHPDQRLRQDAHLTLAAKGADALPLLVAAAQPSEPLVTRLHGLWGLGRLVRKYPPALLEIAPFLRDQDAHVRALAAQLLGDYAHVPAAEKLIEIVKNKKEDARVRFYAAQSLGKLKRNDALPALLALLAENNDQDRYLRHAAAYAISRLDAPLAELPTAAAAEEMGLVLALRHRASPDVAKFLASKHPRVVLEAARAIYDLPIDAAMPKLAALAERTDWLAWKDEAEPLGRRVLAAELRVGNAAAAQAAARWAGMKEAPQRLRIDSVEILARWTDHSGRDRVTGLWRPLEKRDAEPAVAAAAGVWPDLVKTAPDPVRLEALKAAGPLPLTGLSPVLVALVAEKKTNGLVRAEALRALGRLNGPGLSDAVRGALADASPDVRTVARDLLAKLDAGQAVAILGKTLDEGAVSERQAAYRTLSGMKKPEADALLKRDLEKLVSADGAAKVPATVQLDLLAAASLRGTPELKQLVAQYEKGYAAGDALAPYRVALEGGDREAGKKIFFEKAAVACLRCHVAEGKGGEVGPVLSDVGLREKRETLLEAIVEPNKKIAKGFESVVVQKTDGTVVTGVLRSENEKELLVITAENKRVVIPVGDVEERSRAPSAMPDTILKQLSKEELRDLVEYLASLKTPPKQPK